MNGIPITTTQFATATTLLSEVALALHPILIKQLNTTLPTQLLSRLGVYSLLAFALSSQQERIWTWGSGGAALQSLGLGLMNLVHIASSYLSYELLPAGSALALFYTYPFFNILAGILFLGDSLDLRILPLIVMAFVGVLLIARYTKDGNHKEDKGANEGNVAETKDHGSIALGIGAALLSALTETMIFLVAKTAEAPSPFITILRLYPAALLGLLGYIGVKQPSISTKSSVWIPMILFNVFIGFLGYSLRFFSIPRLPTAIFSILTFVGVAAGYTWGLAYAKEIPSGGALAGAGLITAALGILRSVT